MPDGIEALNGRTSVQDLLREARERRVAWRREHEARSAEALRERQAEVRRMTGAGERTGLDEVASPTFEDDTEQPAAGAGAIETMSTPAHEAPVDSVKTVVPEPMRETTVPVVAEAPVPVALPEPAPAPKPGVAMPSPGSSLPSLGALWMGVGAMHSSSSGGLPAVAGSGNDDKPSWARAKDGVSTPSMATPMPAPVPVPAAGPKSGDGIRFRRVDTAGTGSPAPLPGSGVTPFRPAPVATPPVAPAPGGTLLRRTDAGIAGSAGTGGGGSPAWARQVRPGG